MTDSCLVCDEVSGRIPVSGGFLQADDHLVVFQSPIVAPATDVYAGYLFVAPVRHAAGFADLTDEEAAAVGLAITRWSRALEEYGAEEVYVLRVGHGVPHLHVHVIPRWPETPSTVPWMQVDEWHGARRGDYEAAAAFVEALRRSIADNAPRLDVRTSAHAALTAPFRVADANPFQAEPPEDLQ